MRLQVICCNYVEAAIKNWVRKLISGKAQATIGLRLFGFARIPMMYYYRRLFKLRV
jgi:hypothetical protein